MGIACELKRIRDYQIDVEDSVVKLSEDYDYGYKLAKLTIDNVAKVEAMIRTDSRYRKMYDENKGPSPSNEYRTAGDFKRDDWDYIGSTAYWMKRISEYPDNTELQDIKFLIGASVLR